MVERKTEKSLKEGVMWLVVHENKVLLEERKKEDSSYFGYTMVPGGKVDEGETVVEALFREVFEEHRIVPKSYSFLDSFENTSQSGNHYLMHAFLITDFEGEIISNEPESARVILIDLEQAKVLLKLGTSRYVLALGQSVLREAR